MSTLLRTIYHDVKVCFSTSFEPPEIDLCSACHIHRLSQRARITSILFILTSYPASRAINFYVSSFFSFIFFQSFLNCRLCQLLALCLKCCHTETWTGFQTISNISIRKYAKWNNRSSLSERCVRITNLLMSQSIPTGYIPRAISGD